MIALYIIMKTKLVVVNLLLYYIIHKIIRFGNTAKYQKLINNFKL